MKKLLCIFLAMLSFGVFASDIDAVFDTGEDEYQFRRFSKDHVWMEIDKDASVECDGGICRMHSLSNSYGEFEASFSLGEGNNNVNNGGTTIITGDQGQNEFCEGDDCRQFWNVTLRYTKGRCKQTISVDKTTYQIVKRYMFSLIDEKGDVRRGFTPAQEAMIMFNTTILGKLTGCSGPTR